MGTGYSIAAIDIGYRIAATGTGCNIATIGMVVMPTATAGEEANISNVHIAYRFQKLCLHGFYSWISGHAM